MFLKKKDLAQARQRIKRYQQFKALNTQLVRAYINLVRKTGFQQGE